eukprot:TRINITY_DN3416_c0_g1_i2.p1 TRINITY_DN3416_c0_g1~~TRINITY_DN3416_c0_g1_i2.p1  ORF type:complete len:105 (-),score=11.45 TRINITY_DN3416_c0_g1_i2:351-665(-)
MAERNKRAKRSQYVEYGGKTDKYTWDQFEDEVVINVTFPPGTRGKDIDCVFHKKYLKLQKKGEPAIFDVRRLWTDCTSCFVITCHTKCLSLVKSTRDLWGSYEL